MAADAMSVSGSCTSSASSLFDSLMTRYVLLSRSGFSSSDARIVAFPQMGSAFSLAGGATMLAVE